MNRIYFNRFLALVKKSFCLCILSGFVLPVSSSDHISHKEIREIADICMYSQRLLKDYALIGLGVDYHNPKKDLAENLVALKSYFVDLKSHQYDSQITQGINQLEVLWQKIEPDLTSKPVKSKMQKLHKLVEEFSHECELIALQMAKQLNEKEQNVVLIAELGMETQRMAALYMMKVWDVASPNYDQQVEDILTEYSEIYHKLLNANDDSISAEIKQKLKNLEKRFLVFKFMAASKSGRFVPTVAEKNASKIFEEISHILELEEGLL